MIPPLRRQRAMDNKVMAIREEVAAAYRRQLIAQVDANRAAAIQSPQCAEWSNGIAQGFQEALDYFDAIGLLRDGKGEGVSTAEGEG